MSLQLSKFILLLEVFTLSSPLGTIYLFLLVANVDSALSWNGHLDWMLFRSQPQGTEQLLPHGLAVYLEHTQALLYALQSIIDTRVLPPD